MRLDLTNAELDLLDTLLQAPALPDDTLPLLALDGYLAGVLVQPRIIAPSEWLPPIFGLAPQAALPMAVEARCVALIERRHAALATAIDEDGWFEPLVADPDDLPPASEYDALQSPVSRALEPWVQGFAQALHHFAELVETGDDTVAAALQRILRHSAPTSDADREQIARLDRELPLATLDAAIEDLVDAVLDLWEATFAARLHVQQRRRETPKVGRNDPCPCGSGKKFKHCHGAS